MTWDAFWRWIDPVDMSLWQQGRPRSALAWARSVMEPFRSKRLPAKEWVEALAGVLEGLCTKDVLFNRAGAETSCQSCGKAYIDHPHDWRTGALDAEGRPFLRRLCDGTSVKL